MTSEFGTLLRAWRRRKGLTQEQLAERSGVGVRSIRGFETGERGAPRLATVRLLAEALQLDPGEHDELLAAAAGAKPGLPAQRGAAFRVEAADRVPGSWAGRGTRTEPGGRAPGEPGERSERGGRGESGAEASVPRARAEQPAPEGPAGDPPASQVRADPATAPGEPGGAPGLGGGVGSGGAVPGAAAAPGAGGGVEPAGGVGPGAVPQPGGGVVPGAVPGAGGGASGGATSGEPPSTPAGPGADAPSPQSLPGATPGEQPANAHPAAPSAAPADALAPARGPVPAPAHPPAQPTVPAHDPARGPADSFEPAAAPADARGQGPATPGQTSAYPPAPARDSAPTRVHPLARDAAPAHEPARGQTPAEAPAPAPAQPAEPAHGQPPARPTEPAPATAHANPPAPAQPPAPAPAQPAEPAPQPTSFHHALADSADQLAQAVAGRWRREEEQRQVQDPFPLPVRWTAAPDDLMDHWANIHRAGAGDHPGPLRLDGRLDEVTDLHGRIPSGRLVVLGRAGSGKTILTLRFVLDMLTRRGPADPVPVIFGLASWDPTAVELEDWLVEQLVRDYPGLTAPGPDGRPLAALLVDAGRILPVLDGFDEMAQGLRGAALATLNKRTLPLLLTSRPDEYAAAAREFRALSAAAAVELCDLTLDDLAGYLPRTARRTEPGWDEVLAEMRARPRRRAVRNLVRVLSTPLMIGLARTVYSDAPDRDPAVLLDTARFPTPESIEAHLFDNFVPTVYGRSPKRGRRWDPERARYWLGYLATHLDRLGGRDVAWWRFGDSLGGSLRMVVVGVVAGLLIGIATFVVGVVLDVLFLGYPAAGIMAFEGVRVGLAGGVGFALADAVMSKFRPAALEPSRAGVPPGGRRTRTLHAFRAGLLGGVAFGLAVGLVRGLTDWAFTGNSGYLLGSAIDTVVYVVVFGPAAALAYAAMTLVERPLDFESATSPDESLRSNRMRIQRQLAVFAPVFGLTVALFGLFAVELLEGALGTLRLDLGGALLWGIVGGIGAACGYGLGLTAWGRWVVFARFWLPLIGRLPWAVPEFLDDAYRRGVLRRTGAVYQFRHARLHDHLSADFAAR